MLLRLISTIINLDSFTIFPMLASHYLLLKIELSTWGNFGYLLIIVILMSIMPLLEWVRNTCILTERWLQLHSINIHLPSTGYAGPIRFSTFWSTTWYAVLKGQFRGAFPLCIANLSFWEEAGFPQGMPTVLSRAMIRTQRRASPLPVSPHPPLSGCFSVKNLERYHEGLFYRPPPACSFAHLRTAE